VTQKTAGKINNDANSDIKITGYYKAVNFSRASQDL